MYYPSSENKGADQLRGYREADLRLCFRICRLLVFPWGGSFVYFSLSSCKNMSGPIKVLCMKNENKFKDSKFAKLISLC